MEVKICVTCKKEKPLSEFYQRTDDNHYRSECKICLNKYLILRGQAKKIIAINLMGGCCQDCKQIFHHTLYDFHHLSDKDYHWDQMRNQSIDKIMKELAKCVLLCSNCHRLRHYSYLIPLTLEEAKLILAPKIKIKKYSKAICSECGKFCSHNAVKCQTCSKNHPTKIDWPANEDLLLMLKESNYTQVAKKLGVSDTAIRHRLKVRKLL